MLMEVNKFQGSKGEAGLIELENPNRNMTVLKSACKLRESTNYKRVFINRNLIESEIC